MKSEDMESRIFYTEFDLEIWNQELADFLPRRIFDAHCHLWRDADAGGNLDAGNILRLNVNGERMQKWSRTIFPGCETKFYFLGTPILHCDVRSHNEFLLQESRKHQMPAAALVTPALTAVQAAELLQQGFAGFKPYRLFANDPAQCSIADYLPEEQMEVADQYHAKVTLHLSKRDGLMDPDNQRDLKYYSKKYPHIKWILAHCARAFNCFMLEHSLACLSDLGTNVWYDMSAVCDPYAHALLMKYADRTHLMFGTDNIGAGSDHGKYITWGKAWKFFSGEECPHCRGQATLVVYEQLRAMKQAADMAGLTSDEVKNIFWDNAEKFFLQ